jgi:hypothetical protein
MKRLLAVLSAVALLIAVAAPAASADPVPVGDPYATNSWAQAFMDSNIGNFDTIEFFITGGTGLYSVESPGWSAFSDGSWTSSTPNQYYALGSGTALATLYMTLNFNGGPGDGTLFFTFLAWSGGVGGTLLEYSDGYYTYGDPNYGWTIVAQDLDDLPQDPIDDFNREPTVPDGGMTLALLGVALVGLGALRRKTGV